MLNYKICFSRVVAVSKIRKISYATVVAEISGGLPPYIQPLRKSIEDL